LRAANEKPKKDHSERKKAEESEGHESKGALAAEIAHDINNSLSSIQTSLFILSRIETDKKYREDVFENINEELKKIADSVKVITDIFDPDASVLQVVDLNTEVMRALDLTQRRLKGKGISVTKKITSGLPTIMCVSSHIKQLLLNLIKNAEDALTLAEKKDIMINTREEDGFVKVEVTDTGCGIDKEKLDNILTASYPASEKAGIGLPVCRMIARKYGGDIMIQSEEGRGMTVTVAIPKGEHG
jgi:signal transduction histidine kinase